MESLSQIAPNFRDCNQEGNTSCNTKQGLPTNLSLITPREQPILNLDLPAEEGLVTFSRTPERLQRVAGAVARESGDVRVPEGFRALLRVEGLTPARCGECLK